MRLHTPSLTHVINVVSIMSGISALILSSITWTNTRDMGHGHGHKNHTHSEMSVLNSSIIDLAHQKIIAENNIKRLDTDIQTLFDDLGESNKRQKLSADALRSSVNRTMTENNRKTYEKINDIQEMTEKSYDSLDQRANEMNKKVIKNSRDIRVVKTWLSKHTKDEHKENVTET